jgi:hypothetical protein
MPCPARARVVIPNRKGLAQPQRRRPLHAHSATAEASPGLLHLYTQKYSLELYMIGDNFIYNKWMLFSSVECLIKAMPKVWRDSAQVVVPCRQ